MSGFDASFCESEDENPFQRIIKDLDILLQKRPQPSPYDFPARSEINELVRCLDAIDDQASLFSHQLNIDFKRLEKQNKLHARSQDSGHYYPSSSSSTLNRSTAKARSPNSDFSNQSRERVKQNAFTPIPQNPKTPLRRKSSKVPTLQDTLSEEEIDYRPANKKRARSFYQNAEKRTLSRRKCTETSLQTPDSTVETPSLGYTTPVKPINNRVAAIKATQNSPESFISSPPSTSTLVHDPSSTSNLVKALSQELGIAFNAPQFHDSRPKLEVNQDFSKAKGAFSVQLQTFQTYSEAYLRAFNQNDLKILEPHNLEYEYLVVPPPQDDSKDLWNENSKSNALKTSGKVKSAAASDPDFFTQRLFSALLPTIQNDVHEPNIEDEQIVVDDILPEETHDKVTSCLSTTPSFDTRVKYELSLLGLVQEDTSPQPPFDEITAELLRLQTKLRDLNRYNNSKKMRLRKMTTDHLAYQEYSRIMDLYDNKLESAFLKRQSSAKKSRKKQAGPSRGVPEEILPILEQRSRFCTTVGKVFKPEMLQLPKTSRYTDIPCPPSLYDIFPPKGKPASN